MSVAAHLAELTEKHRNLDLKIEEEMNHPAADSTKIRQWKMEKLKLKDEMARLSQVKH